MRTVLSLALLSLAAVARLSAAEIHVDGAATGPGDGSSGAPYPTIQAAAAMAVAGDTVRIHAGTYRETVVPAHAGTAAEPIVYTAAGDGPVVIDGADVIDGWSRVAGSDHVWQASYAVPFASTLNQHEQLFCDGTMLWTARTPDRPVGRGLFHPDAVLRVSAVQSIADVGQGTDTPWGPVAKGGARRITFTCDALDDPAAAWPAGATLGLQPHENQSWGFWCIGPIESYADGQITAVLFTGISQDQHAFSRVTAGTPFFLARGDGSELDAPGEWYHDRAAGRVRVWLPDGGDPNEHAMTIKQRDYAFDLSGLAHIEVRDLAVHAATITTDNLLGDGVGMGAWLTHNRGSVDIPAVQGNASAHHITLERVQARHLNHFLGTWGNYHTQWIMSSGLMIAGTAHTVRDCRIAQTAGNGIVLFGTDHRVTGTLIHDVNYSGALTSGIYIAQTPGNTPGTPVKPDRIEIDHNTLVCAGWGLIDGSSLYTSDPATPSRIHHNHISAAGLLTRDVGGIRFVGHTVDNPLRTGPTRIDHNVVRNVVAALGNPIYFDFCDDYVVDHNLIYDCNQGININDAYNLTVTNNTMVGFSGGIGGVSRDKSSFFNMADTLVRNNICSGSVLDNGGNIAPSYTADHNLEDAPEALFVDPATGDYRLRADASAAIDAGSTAVPSPGPLAGAPDLGCFERGHDDWLEEVGVANPVHARPTDVVARARRDGTVDLTWHDATGGTAAHWIDRGYKTDHPNGGWEFLTVGRTAPGTSRFVDVVDGPPATSYYRVRAVSSIFSPWAVSATGTTAGDTITFGADQGYTDGPLFGQGPWAADPYTATDRDTTLVDGGVAEVRANETLIVYGDFGVIDPAFDDTASRVGFSLRLRLRAITAGDTGAALRVRVGGYGIWKHSTYAFEIGLRRDGYLYANTAEGWKGIGAVTDFAASATDWVTVTGVLDYDQRRVTDLAVNGVARNAGWVFKDTHADLHDGLWQLLGSPASAEAAVVVDDLRLRIDPAPTLWLTAVDADLDEAGDHGELRIGSSAVLVSDLQVALGLDGASEAELADIDLIDAATGNAVDPAAVVVPAGAAGLRLRIVARADGAAEPSESLVWRLDPASDYRLDPDPLKTVASMHIAGDADAPRRRIQVAIVPLARAVQINALVAGISRLYDGSTPALFEDLNPSVDETLEILPDPNGDG